MLRALGNKDCMKMMQQFVGVMLRAKVTTYILHIRWRCVGIVVVSALLSISIMRLACKFMTRRICVSVVRNVPTACCSKRRMLRCFSLLRHLGRCPCSSIVMSSRARSATSRGWCSIGKMVNTVLERVVKSPPCEPPLNARAAPSWDCSLSSSPKCTGVWPLRGL